MTDHVSTLNALLDRFDRARAPGPTTYRWAHRHDGGEHDTHLVFSSIIHGNEVGSLPGLVRAVEDLAAGRLSHGGRETFLLGNPEAAEKNVRFLEADLNRVFLPELDETIHEHRRARELMTLLDEADVYLDFHQTLKASRQPFYIFPWSEQGWLWVRALGGAEVWVTRNPGLAFSSGMMCADEYVRARGKPGITLELGEKGWGDEPAERTYQMIVDALRFADDLAAGRRSLREAAEARPDVHFFQTEHRVLFKDRAMRLAPGIANFEPVTAGQLLSAPGTPELRAPADGAVLFPKYPPRNAEGLALNPRPKEIFRVITELAAHPMELWG